jgi:hypothetical protein
MELDRVGAATSCRLAFLWRRSGSSCRVGGAECRCPRARCAVHSPAIFNSLETRVTVYVHSITITHIVRYMQFASGSKIWFELAERYSVRANFQAHRIFFFHTKAHYQCIKDRIDVQKRMDLSLKNSSTNEKENWTISLFSSHALSSSKSKATIRDY